MKLHHQFADALPSLSAASVPAPSKTPNWAFFNQPLADQLGLTQGPELLAILAGNQVLADSHPVACAYSGHQFGQFNPNLGDGRAHLLGELQTENGWIDLALKGSGRTPFSRSGDGKGTLSAMLREVIISESLFALGVPTTRSLAVVSTGETVARMGPEPGAVLTRTAASHIRVGSFEHLAAREQHANLEALFEYTCQRHYPEIDTPMELLAAVCQRQAQLIAHWMSLGFIHGVMNTDNMTLSGESIDFGPCAFMDHYDPDQVFSSIDRQGRYRYRQQPAIGQWNLTRLAESLLPLMEGPLDDRANLAKAILDDYAHTYQAAFAKRMATKLGTPDPDILTRWLSLLSEQSADWTWAHALLDDFDQWITLFTQPEAARLWYQDWQALAHETDQRVAANPWVIPRNHRVEAALASATAGNLQPALSLIADVQTPFEPIDGWQEYGPGDSAFYQSFRTYCGT